MNTIAGESQPIGLPELLRIAGFWRRLGALILDLILLGIVGWLIGAVLFDSLARMGDWARLIGFAIALAYFGLLDSRLHAGRTLGNKLFDVRVVDIRGASLSIPRSLLRYTVLSAPYFLNYLSVDTTSMVILAALSFVVLGGILSITYLYIFNRRTRQSLHDLVVGSYVVRGESEGSTAAIPRIWSGHLVVMGVIFVLCLIGPFVASRFVNKAPFAQLLITQGALSRLPHVRTVSIMDGSLYMNGTRTTSLVAQLRLDAPSTEDKALAEHAAHVMFNIYPGAASESAIVVNLVYGYNMGIASGWKRHGYSFKPIELM